MKTIGYVTPYNPFEDRKAFSGVIYKLRAAIEKAGFQVIWIPYQNKINNMFFKKTLNKIGSMIGQSLFSGSLCIKDLKKWAATIDMSKIANCDALFFPTNSQISLFLDTDKPIINFSDATVQQMLGYYWYGYNHKSSKEACMLETKAAQISTLLIRPSQWAIDSLVRDCGVNPCKCHLLEYGPCIDEQDINPINHWQDGQLNILFSGVDWKRKGGVVAVETTTLLRQTGIDARLIIVGPKNKPKECNGLDFVSYIGFLDKNSPSDYTKYIKLFRESHIFLLPTQAECAGIVFAEASAFGLPCYTYNTGGVPSYVIDGYNGHTLPINGSADDFCRCILDDIRNYRLKQFHDGGIMLSKEKLSWNAWSKKFKNIINNL